MENRIPFDKCLTFINCQLQPADALGRARQPKPRKLAITLSRQTGAGALIVAEGLADFLQAHAPKDSRPWTVFDRNLVEKVLDDHHLPAKLAQFMPEDRRSEIADIVEELLGLHPPSWTLVRQVTETILKLADLGNVILVGRGANVITNRLPHVFHVRLVGSLEQRVARVQEHMHLNAKAAAEHIATEERGRERYLQKHFRADINDPLSYHLVINTDRVPLDEATRIIGEAALRHR
jgi:cytidylate kinase